MFSILLFAVFLLMSASNASDAEIPQWFQQDMNDELPPASVSVDGKVSFNIPSMVESRLDAFPQGYLQGACLQTYRGFADGNRIDRLITHLGDDTRDFIIEFVLFDFLSNHCRWMCRYWGDLIDDWEWVTKKDSGILKSITVDFDSLANEMQAWFGWWITENPEMYADGVLEWKMEVAYQFLSLKTTSEFVSDFPQMESVDRRRRILEEDEQTPIESEWATVTPVASVDECTAVNPVAHFHSIWEPIAKRMHFWRSQDVTRTGPRTTPPQKTVYRLNIVTVVCAGVCIEVGAGFTWDFRAMAPQVHWTYGVGDFIDTTTSSLTPAHVKLELQVFCQDIDDIGTSYGPLLAFGKTRQGRGNMMFRVLSTSSPSYDFVGYSFSKPWDGMFDDRSLYSFTHVNTGPIGYLRSPFVEEDEAHTETETQVEVSRAPVFPGEHLTEHGREHTKEHTRHQKKHAHRGIREKRDAVLPADVSKQTHSHSKRSSKSWFFHCVLAVVLIAMLVMSWKICCGGSSSKAEISPLLGGVKDPVGVIYEEVDHYQLLP